MHGGSSRNWGDSSGIKSPHPKYIVLSYPFLFVCVCTYVCADMCALATKARGELHVFSITLSFIPTETRIHTESGAFQVCFSLVIYFFSVFLCSLASKPQYACAHFPSPPSSAGVAMLSFCGRARDLSSASRHACTAGTLKTVLFKGRDMLQWPVWSSSRQFACHSWHGRANTILGMLQDFRVSLCSSLLSFMEGYAHGPAHCEVNSQFPSSCVSSRDRA